MNEWQNFFIAQAGAAAALTGLIFVAVSLNLTKILSLPNLPVRALLSLFILVNILIVSSLMLVPQSRHCEGIEIFILGLSVWIIVTVLDLKSIQKTVPEFRTRAIQNMLLSQLALLPYIAAGIILYTGNSTGIYWLVPAMLISFCKAILDAWVLLVEINR